MSAITPVILSGGSGTRLWPLSRKALPKQFLNLAGPRSMIRETLTRVTGAGFAAPVVVCAEDHRFLVAEQLRQADVQDARIVLEPAGRSTAPAAAIAALLVAADDPGGLLLLTPSDHVVADRGAFAVALEVAVKAAAAGAMVTFGIAPTAPETGYGYIRAGGPLDGAAGAFRIAQFVEKPDRPTAERYVASGGYSWNSGMFLFRADILLAELERLEPALLDACRLALRNAHRDRDFIRLEEAAFCALASRSLDHAVMERTGNAAVVPVAMGWSDVGSWRSLWEIAGRTADGNVLTGNVLAQDVCRSYLRSEGPLVAAVGVENLVVVATSDAVLVCHRNEAQDVRKIVDQLEALGSDRHVLGPVVRRPWGSYEDIDQGPGFLVKRITVNPGQKLSLQMHHHRAEQWVVVEGTALVTCGARQFSLPAGESTHIPLGEAHRLENPGSAPLVLIEVQSGARLSEEDIVRFEDVYGRAQQALK
ncbi:MAG TPA: mannose-1-phosphate guanylyltransferase/mannose-6-phosphate isomerase [Rhizomicrobium sp.]|nr:mannose-1-phosphate guanylyltransferase/mannose-6-phosphate isomerase [Rhizomicrobium sp.]